MHQKQIKYLLLFSLICTLFLPLQVFAEESSPGKGKLEIRTDNLYEKEDTSEIYETELDRTFPDIFQNETQEHLDSVQKKKRHMLLEIQKQAITNDMPNTSLLGVKDELFTKDYEATVSRAEEQEETTSNFISTLLFYGSISFFIFIIVVVLYFIGRKIDF